MAAESGSSATQGRSLWTSMRSGFQSSFHNAQSTLSRGHGPSTFYTSEDQPKVKSGLLKKIGGVVKSWHQRWFVLSGDTMYYFTAEDEKKQQGYISLAGNRVIELPRIPNEPEKFLFEIIPGGDRTKMNLTHETFTLWAISDDERKSWIHAIRKVLYSHIGGAIFGQRLEETMYHENKIDMLRKVPIIVHMCVEFIMENGLEAEGIFRLSGRTTMVRQMREMFDCAEQVEFGEEIDVHTVASLLKEYLRELPEPIISYDFYEIVHRLVTRDMQIDPDVALEKLSEVLCKLPPTRYNLLQYISQFLKHVSNHESSNRMSAMNLATVFVQSMMRPEDNNPALLMGTAEGRTMVAFAIISQCDYVFRAEYQPDGSLVLVDNLLRTNSEEEDEDVGVTVSNSRDFSAHYLNPSCNNDDADLLGLQLDNSDTNHRASRLDLPPPLIPTSNEDLRNSIPNIDENIVDKQNVIGLNTLIPHRTSMCNNEEPDFAEIYRKPIARARSRESRETLYSNRLGGIPTIYDQSRESSTSSSVDTDETFHDEPNSPAGTSDLGRSISIESPIQRQVPQVPPRPSLIRPSLSSISTEDSGLNGDGYDSEDESIDNLISTDITKFSVKELHTHISTLRLELRSQRSKCKDATHKLKVSREKQVTQMYKMAEKLDEEKVALSSAVDKIYQLQTEKLSGLQG